MSKPMRRQRGFSLVELMIALVLGLMVSGAVLQAFIYNNRGVELQREAVSLQEQARAALEFVTRYTRMAGFQEDDLTTSSLDSGVSGADNSLTIEYRAGSASTASVSLYDCLGRPTSAGWVSVNSFTISGESFVCNAHFRNESSGATAKSESGILIERIKDFDMLYGVDPDGDGAANRYVKSGPDIADWSHVVALKVCLILESKTEILPSAMTYQDCEGQDYPDTKRMVRQVKTTIALRNRTGGG